MFKTIMPNGKVKYQERYKDYITGKWKTVSIIMDKDTAGNRKLAAAELARKIDDKTQLSPSEDIPLQRLYDLYIADQESVLKASTMQRNKITIQKVIDLLGKDAIVNNLNILYVKECLKSVTAQKQREYITRFKVLLNWGYTNELIDNHALILKLKLPADTSRKERIADKYLEPDEVITLLNSMSIPDWCLLTKFLILSGLRIGEAIALTADDIDDKYIHVTKTYDTVNRIVTDPKTATSTRAVYIQPELASLLREIRRNELEKQILHSRKSKLIFSSVDGSYIHYDSYRQYLADTSKNSIGRHITPHALRHTHASLLLAEGIDVDAISRRLGHADSKITKDIYLHMTEKLKQAEENQISKVKIL